MLDVVAQARGVSRERAAVASLRTFCDFYEGFLPVGALRAQEYAAAAAAGALC